MAPVFQYYVIVPPREDGGQWVVYGYDNPDSREPRVYVDEFLTDGAATAYYPRSVIDSVWQKPWPHGLPPCVDE